MDKYKTINANKCKVRNATNALRHDFRIRAVSLVASSIEPVSRDIVSPIRLSRRMNKSNPRMDYTGIAYPLKTNIRHETQPVNAKLCTVIVYYQNAPADLR